MKKEIKNNNSKSSLRARRAWQSMGRNIFTVGGRKGYNDMDSHVANAPQNDSVEKGRSMVEMLGVLAIIGVLSIGGIAGYTMAMNRHKANEILDIASKLSTTMQSMIAANPNITPDKKVSLITSAANEISGTQWKVHCGNEACAMRRPSIDEWEITWFLNTDGSLHLDMGKPNSPLAKALSAITGNAFYNEHYSDYIQLIGVE